MGGGAVCVLSGNFKQQHDAAAVLRGSQVFDIGCIQLRNCVGQGVVNIVFTIVMAPDSSEMSMVALSGGGEEQSSVVVFIQGLPDCIQGSQATNTLSNKSCVLCGEAIMVQTV